MYCSKCGSYVNENYLFCTTCGASMKARQPRQFAYQPSVNMPLSTRGYSFAGYQNPAFATTGYGNSYNQSSAVSYNSEYRDLGGFLKFLVIMVMVYYLILLMTFLKSMILKLIQ